MTLLKTRWRNVLFEELTAIPYVFGSTVCKKMHLIVDSSMESEALATARLVRRSDMRARSCEPSATRPVDPLGPARTTRPTHWSHLAPRCPRGRATVPAVSSPELPSGVGSDRATEGRATNLVPPTATDELALPQEELALPSAFSWSHKGSRLFMSAHELPSCVRTVQHRCRCCP